MGRWLGFGPVAGRDSASNPFDTRYFETPFADMLWPGGLQLGRDGIDPTGLVRAQPSCYIPAVARRFRHASTPHAVVAELVDALA